MPGTYVRLPSATVHTVQFGSGQPELLAVHGLGGSAYNWMDLARILDRPMLAIDLPGFGYSPPVKRHSPAVFARVVSELIETTDSPAAIIGNSMGGLVAMLVAAGRPELVSRLILVDPACRPAGRIVPGRLTVPGRLLAQSLPVLGPAISRLIQVRLSPAEQVKMTLGLICADPRAVSMDAIREMTEVARRRRSYPWATRAFHESIQATGLLLAGRVSYDAMADSIVASTLLLFGTEDPVVEPAWMRTLGAVHPVWSTVELEGVGHVPILERPAWTAEVIQTWMESKAA